MISESEPVNLPRFTGKSSMANLKPYLAVYIFSILFFSLSFFSATSESLTYDEPAHIMEGQNAVYDQKFLVDVVNPPLLREIAIMPMYLTTKRLSRENINSFTVLPGRIVIICLGIILIFSVYHFIQKSFSVPTAVAAVALLALEPNMISYSHYVTMDFGFAVLFFMAYSFSVHTILNPNIIKTVTAGIFWGLALISKAAALYYLPLSLVPALIIFLTKRKYKLLSFRMLSGFFIFSVAVFLVVWAGYFFSSDSIISDVRRPGRLSEKLLSQAGKENKFIVVNTINILKEYKIPAGNYFSMIKNSLIYARQQSNSRVYFAGRYFDSPKWYFIPLVLVMKMQPLLLILFCTGLFRIIKMRDQRGLLLLPPIAVILAINMLSPVSPRLRYVLPIIPFIAAVAAYTFYLLNINRIKKLSAVVFFILFTEISVNFPHYLSYSNFLSGLWGPKYIVHSDSNLDWGQGLISLRKYLAKHHYSEIKFSYFGQDLAGVYGYNSNKSWGSYRFDDVCAFHDIVLDPRYKNKAVIISVTNWHQCGYMNQKKYTRDKIMGYIADTFLLFEYD